MPTLSHGAAFDMALVEKTHQIYKEEIDQLLAQLREFEDASSRLTVPEHDPQYQRELRRLANRLPAYAHRSLIVTNVLRHLSTVVIGDTGSGKSTQIAAFLADSGKFPLQIAVTQPRKVATIALARRVAEEWGCKVLPI